MQDIEQQFHTCMLQVSENARRKGYNPTYFVRMVYELGGVKAAKQLLSTHEVQEGLMRLWELNLLDESMEAYVLKPQFASLFTNEECAEAQRRLAALNYRVE
jgi:hypothetical protein